MNTEFRIAHVACRPTYTVAETLAVFHRSLPWNVIPRGTSQSGFKVRIASSIRGQGLRSVRRLTCTVAETLAALRRRLPWNVIPRGDLTISFKT